MTKRPEDLLGGVRPPTPPASLREQILTAARAVTPESDSDAGLIDRFWESRPLWLSWAFLVSSLLMGHAILIRSDRSATASIGTVVRSPVRDLGIGQHAFADERRRGPRFIDAILDPSLSDWM